MPITITRGYAETFAAATVWTVTHRLGTWSPVVDCFSGGSPDEKIMPVSIVALTENKVQITWSDATAGRVYVV